MIWGRVRSGPRLGGVISKPSYRLYLSLLGSCVNRMRQASTRLGMGGFTPEIGFGLIEPETGIIYIQGIDNLVWVGLKFIFQLVL